MRTIIQVLMLGALPGLVIASGKHAGGHQEHGSHAMSHMDDQTHEVAAGRPGNPVRVDRTITVLMNDTMRFEPASMSFKAGETIRFEVMNTGKITHEMVIGTLDELKEHADMMEKMPGMAHTEPNMISLAPGEQGDLVWKFDNTGTFDFACLIPGHLEAGMSGRIKIE
ncbi:MAG: cupredoxin family protein [Thiohalophilus sp.]|uniref:cupredoxin domain-containing protein n=1 Tax=Thiohalophilus sp. TaxID=3028392 RepID=UPI0028708686|nr:cupredoxin family protein [Thiohalophilus sp.]MDR9437038.1 cupredoxin family protein [Thiohalophilus sp.]